jgi:hypothetical protein
MIIQILFSKMLPNVVYAQTYLDNPLGNIENIEDITLVILNFVMTVGVPLIAIFIIIAGFNFVTAQGDPGKLGKAKQALMWTLIGAAVLMGAVVLSALIKDTAKDFMSTTELISPIVNIYFG